MKTVSETARTLCAEALIWDMVWPWDPHVGNDFERFHEFREGGYNVISITLAGDNHNAGDAVKLIGEIRQKLKNHQDICGLATSIADIETLKAEGKLAVLLHFEGTNCLESRLELVEVFYDLGIRHNLLAFNTANSCAGGCAEKVDGGLTAFGRKVIREMERVGMLLDLSHTGHKTAMDAMEFSTKPCVYTHSNINALHQHYRNLSDDEIRRCAGTGGLIGVSGSSGYLGDQQCNSTTIFQHIDYVVQLLGSCKHSGLGLDIVFDPTELNDYVRANPDEWPAESAPDWPGFHYARPRQIVEVVDIMLTHGYAPTDISQILGGNYLRICAQVWK